jgi:DNA-binding CsgD family transcriptional regulator
MSIFFKTLTHFFVVAMLPDNPLELTQWAKNFAIDPDVDNYYPSVDKLIQLCGHRVFSNQFYYIADVQAQKIIYTTPSIRETLGYPPGDITSPQFFYENTHKDDRKQVCLATAKSLLCGVRYPHLHPFECTFSLNFRLKKRCGEYVTINRQTTLVSRDMMGNMHLTLALYTMSNNAVPSNPHHYSYNGPVLKGFEFPDKDIINASGGFTRREIQIVRLIAEGLNSQEIGCRLFISANTVNTHRRNIMHKVGARNCAQLVAYAQEKGMIYRDNRL